MYDQQRSKQKLVLELLLVFDVTRFDCQSQLQTIALCTKKVDLKTAIRVTKGDDLVQTATIHVG